MKKALGLGLLVAAIFLVQFSTASSTKAVTAGAASELRPNLRALPPDDFRLTNAGGITKLWFSVTTWNDGLGPLELVASETASKNPKVHQRVYRDDGSSYDHPASSFFWHDTHNHIHVEDYARYTLELKDAPGASTRISNKTTFCILDTDKIDHKLPGASKKRVYKTCGAEVQGMSVGWGDTYTAYTVGQNIVITDLADGQYTLTVEVDPMHVFLEREEGDNFNSVDLQISITDGTVQVLGDDHPGNGKCPHC